MKTQILIPVTVPAGDYCWDGHESCEQFDNEGGHPTCSCDNLFKGYYSLKYDKEGKVPKHPYCLAGGEQQ